MNKKNALKQRLMASHPELAMAAERLSEASIATMGKGPGREWQQLERLMDENPVTD